MFAEITNAHLLRPPLPYYYYHVKQFNRISFRKYNFNLPPRTIKAVAAAAAVDDVEIAGGPQQPFDEKERLRRSRISKANTGNTPWNKGLKHSPETLQKIKERTRIAMQNPKVKIKLISSGHAQTSETRLKIGAGVRKQREKKRRIKMLQDTFCFEWLNFIAQASRQGFIGQEELQWNSYETLDAHLTQEWLTSVEERKLMPRASFSNRAPKSPQQRQKIAQAVSAKWADPEYREKVVSALLNYHRSAVRKPRKLHNSSTVADLIYMGYVEGKLTPFQSPASEQDGSVKLTDQVKQDGFFPADLLFLASTNADGVYYIETANLDGETNLKIRKALEKTWDYLTPEKASEFKGEIQCEQPNNSLYTFTGNLLIQKQTLPLSPNQILLRGCSLRNTEYIVGVVIFTGQETKVMMNSMNVPSKRSTLERKLDKLILALFATLFMMCFIGAIGSAIFVNKKYFYLHLDSSEEGSAQFNPKNRFLVFILTMFTLITLYSTIIPISLYVSIEMIKFIQSTQFINKDLGMYHNETNTPALARTSNLNEELGQVEYIFSDKTGTLTRNLMEFFKCSIGVEVYGNGVTEIERGLAERNGMKIEENRPPHTVHEKGFNFEDARLMRGAWRNEPNPDACREFFRCLAICHTVLPEGDEQSPEKIKYQAASPDEAALVIAAKNFGFFFYRRTPTTIYVRESHVEKMGKVQDLSYEILNVLEFNSTRKRQSVVCRCPDGRLVLYCKGADNVIYERLADYNNDIKKITREYLEQFGSSGLRTLCLAYRELHPDVYESWNEKFIQAKSSLHDREKKLDEVAELIENDLILIGSTAIEDKLQEGVPACIETLQRAGIKIWVLTGDKIETAINIAYACNLINNDMKQFVISSETDAIREVEERGDQVEIARFIKEEVKKELKKSLEEAQSYFHSLSGPKLALIIDGKCLMYALDPSLRVMLLNLSLNCHAVVCCRVSPLQKAQVTSMVKKGAKKITLSIGDGANDVSMIQAAHVGVGISGMEGMQAVMASDFAIAQFRYLEDLLLVHGRWSYLRICKVVLYFFYKNLTFTLTQFWFTFQTGFSGQRFYDDWNQSLYNVIFSALPVIIVGLFDKDVSASLSKKYPTLYMEGIKNVYFQWKVVAIWAFFSVYQSLVFFFFVSTSNLSAKNSAGKTFGLWDVSTMAFTCVVVTVNLRLLMICNSITRWHYISVGGSILAWFVFIFIYSGITTPYDRQENVYFVIYVLMSTVYFYLTLLLVPVAALFCDFVYQGVQRWFFPYDYQIVQEMHRDEIDSTGRAQLLEIGNQLSPTEARSYAISQLPRELSKHTGFAFDSPGYESFFATQLGAYAPPKAWDVARRASMRSRPKTEQKK